MNSLQAFYEGISRTCRRCFFGKVVVTITFSNVLGKLPGFMNVAADRFDNQIDEKLQVKLEKAKLEDNALFEALFTTFADKIGKRINLLEQSVATCTERGKT